MSKINETNYPRRTQASYEDTDMLVIQESGGNTHTTRIEDLREDYEETLAPTIDKINDALAPAENGATASQSYAIGEHFMRDGAFCTAIAAITSGGSFTLNTNYKVDDVANNLEQLNSDLTSVDLSSDLSYDTGVTNYMSRSSVRKIGNFVVVTLSFQNSAQINAWSRFAKLAIPHDYAEIAIKLDGAYVYSAWDSTNQLYGIYLGDSTLAAGYHACQLIFTHT